MLPADLILLKSSDPKGKTNRCSLIVRNVLRRDKKFGWRDQLKSEIRS
jgi:hypothetical protein